jgi:cytochrome c oxidase assembly protein subunit 15
MVVLGGVTRLTGSGLSIVEWKPIHGTLPPLNVQEWEEEFAAYQATPEYMKKNAYMTLEGFKGIFWLEYWHRVLGRIIGLAFLFPALYYAWKKSLPPVFIWRNFVLVGMVGAQGLMGWLMVKSGLVDNPHVSHYRLAAHLLLASAIASVVFITIKQVERYEGAATIRIKSRVVTAILCLIVAQITYGAFVAGLKAGYIYNEFPLMGGQFFPPEEWMLTPVWQNLLEHHATVQFIHRWLGCVVLAAIIWQYMRCKNAASLWVLVVAGLQVGLGIATLLSGVQIALASLHQLVAILLLLTQLHLWMGHHERIAT